MIRLLLEAVAVIALVAVALWLDRFVTQGDDD